ncbi:dihydrolipoyllysine-residue acetyltransferase component of pyruvate dehydrogenase complex [Dictyobacter vulcani]|uniref:Dihydrolipoamide acetyltransferase component of pyruvate dehydrogenase complex n=1 Tax=Dictyobacter vulcani TaxID=2607529 RepID=A0A5J4KQI0_9CHLR|nr:dihydrolipoamide acetyltransferase family protein [Dictyobacter vulcani]GER89452.1 dihydrolipoyllysine-residue acetyltransferase component of pyruvate dehydrogenase complex [Dictyobacter vulcani]
MTVEFHLPDLGEGITEAEIVRWLVKPGDNVIQDQEIVAVQTDKAVVELPSPVAGTVIELAVAEGEIVPVKSVLLRFSEENQESTSNGSQVNGHTKQSAAVTLTAAVSSLQTAAPSQHNGSKQTGGQRPPHPNRTLATPVARRMAREFNIDIASLTGTGHSGRVRTEDVQQAIARLNAPQETVAATRSNGTSKPVSSNNGTATTSPAAQPVRNQEDAQAEERIPLRGMRRKIAENMVLSVSTIPQVASLVEVDASGLVELRKQLLPVAEAQNIKLSYLPFIVKALVQALKQYPYINACIDNERQEIVLKREYHIGIATSIPDGLLVPVLRHADRLTLLATEINRLAEAGRQQQLQRDELRGSTFTISNYGNIGGFFTTPIINPGEAGILGLGRITKRPWVVEDQLEVRPVLPLSFTADHRLIDGELAMRFLNTLISTLEQPQRLLLNMR